MRYPALFTLALIAVGCGSKTPSPAPLAPPAPADPWVMTNFDAKAETPSLLWNGLIGVRLSTLRFGRSSLYDITSYEQQGEEKIIALPSPLELQVDSGSTQLSPVSQDFSEKLDMRTGEIVQSWTQGPLKVEVRTAIHPTRRVIGQKWTIQASADAPIRLKRFFAAGKVATSSSATGGRVEVDGPWRCLYLEDRLSTTGALTSTQHEAVWESKLNASTPFVFSTVANLDFGKIKLIETYDEVAKASADEWSKRWQTDIELDGPVEDQQAIRSFLFYLRSAIHPDGKMSISPMGLSSNIYNGHVFWDADMWVFPALALIDPDKAKAIPEYRLAKGDQAAKNFVQWWVDDNRPTANGKLGPVEEKVVFGVKFPWESSVTGKETVPGPSRFEDHITGSVAFSIERAASLGLATPAKTSFTPLSAGGFYFLRATSQTPSEIKDVVSPDENHTGDNDLYTNLLAMWCTSEGKWPAQPTFKLPKDDKTFLTYDNDALRGYKQAAAVLSIYPLQYPPAEAQAKAMMDRFADKVTKNGPAMSDSIHALIWARLGETDKAYQEWHESWQPFMKPPFLLFSEKKGSSRTYFTTGAAGSLQAVLYGFAGLRIDTKKAENAQWSTPLKGGAILSIAPHLPKAWKKLTLKNLVVLGKRYTFEIANDKVTVTQK